MCTAVCRQRIKWNDMKNFLVYVTFLQTFVLKNEFVFFFPPSVYLVTFSDNSI